MGGARVRGFFSLCLPFALLEIIMSVIERYIEWLIHNKGRSVATAGKYRGYLERLADFLAPQDTTIERATLDQLQQFTGIYAHQSMHLVPRARKPLVASLRSFYHWAERAGVTMTNPAQHLDYPKAGRRLPRTATLADAEAMLMACDLSTLIGVRDAAILAILIGTGCRVSGLCAINEEDLLWYRDDGVERLIIRLREKGSKERLVPAPLETALLIHAYLGHHDLEQIDRTLPDGNRVLFVSTANRNVPAHEYYGEHRRIASRSVFDRIRYYGTRLKIPSERLHPHALRHLFGTEMVEHDINILVTQALMGHGDVKSTEPYVELAVRKKIDAIDRASPMRNINTPVSALARNITGKRARS